MHRSSPAARPRTHGVHDQRRVSPRRWRPDAGDRAEGAGYRTGAFVGAFVLDARFGLSRGFDEYDDRYPHEADTATFQVADRRAAEVVKAAGDWILQPAVASPQSPVASSLVRLGAPVRSACAVRRAGGIPRRPLAVRRRGRLHRRDAGTVCSIGSRAAHALDRTLIVVTADHGESLGDHGETTHGLFAYDSTLAVPLIVSGDHGRPRASSTRRSRTRISCRPSWICSA